MFDIPFSRTKFLKQNLHTILVNPNSGFALDPNNFIVPSGPAPSAADAANVRLERHWVFLSSVHAAELLRQQMSHAGALLSMEHPHDLLPLAIC